MPRTRRDVERAAKIEEILDAAEDQLLDGGYGALSMVGTARRLGVAQNAVYWYFPTKDELFVAALRRLQGRVLAGKPPAGPGLVDQAVWIVDRLAEFHFLALAAHERARDSEVVAAYLAEFRSGLRHMLVSALDLHVAPGQRDLAADVVIATVDGMLLDAVPADRREEMLRFVLARIIGAAPSDRRRPEGRRRR